MVEVGDISIIQLLIGIAPQMGSGEIEQFSNNHRANISLDEYFASIQAKTALLFAASAKLGALISKSNHKIQKGLYLYGLHLGNAFQLIDDAMDYCADAQTMGKNIGDDLANGKATLPLLHALEHGTLAQKNIIIESIEHGSLEHLPQILDALTQTDAINHTLKLAATKIDDAITALSVLPDSAYKEALKQLALYTLERTS